MKLTYKITLTAAIAALFYVGSASAASDLTVVDIDTSSLDITMQVLDDDASGEDMHLLELPMEAMDHMPSDSDRNDSSDREEHEHDNQSEENRRRDHEHERDNMRDRDRPDNSEHGREISDMARSLRENKEDFDDGRDFSENVRGTLADLASNRMDEMHDSASDAAEEAAEKAAEAGADIAEAASEAAEEASQASEEMQQDAKEAIHETIEHAQKIRDSLDED